jgi:hypothetical protein
MKKKRSVPPQAALAQTEAPTTGGLAGIASLRAGEGPALLALHAVLVTAAILLVYGGILRGGFVVDDLLWANTPTSLPSWVDVKRALWSWGFSGSELSAGLTPFFRPLGGLIVQTLHAVVGPKPAAWHAASLALHSVNAVLLLLILRSMLPGLSGSARLLCALLFALHPASAEAVLWISDVAELISGGFVFGLLWIWFTRESALSGARAAGICLLFAAAILTKEAALFLPPLALTYWLVNRNSPPGRQVLALMGAVIVLAMVYLGWRLAVIGSMVGDQDIGLRPVRVLELGLTHLRFLLVPATPPFALAAPEVALAAPWTIALALGLLGAASGFALHRGVPWRQWLLALAAILFSLWPAYAIALVGSGFFAGRHAYLPSAALAVLVALLLSRMPVRPERAGLVFGVLALCWTGVQFWQAQPTVAVWRDNAAVYRQAAAVSPGATGPLVGQAQALLPYAPEQALQLYLRAADIARSGGERANHLFEAAKILGESGRSEQSNDLLQQVIALRPRDSAAWTGLGNNAWAQKRFAEARVFYQRALEYDPANAVARRNLSLLPR